MKKAARTLAKNIEWLLNAVRRRFTGTYAEYVNALIQEVKTVARELRRFENFGIAILFFLRKLNLNHRNSGCFASLMRQGKSLKAKLGLKRPLEPPSLILNPAGCSGLELCSLYHVLENLNVVLFLLG